MTHHKVSWRDPVGARLTDSVGGGAAGGPEKDERLRLFVAVPLPERVVPFVEHAQALLPPLRGLRLANREQFHVTLAFIGEAGPEKAQAAREVVASVAGAPGGEGEFTRFLLLPSRKARVVALAIEDEDGVFGRLFELVMGRLEDAGVMQREKRPFRAHLTIARLREPQVVEPKSECGRATYPVQSLCLYRSELRREGARYTVVTCAELAGDPAPAG